MGTRAGSSCSHDRKQGKDGSWYSAHFLLFDAMSLGDGATVVTEGPLASLNLIYAFPYRHAQLFVPWPF